MASPKQHRFAETVKGKIIISFVLIVCTLVITWGVNRVAFQKITTTVQGLSTPNQKLALLDDLFRDVNRLNYLQRTEVLSEKSKPSGDFVHDYEQVHQHLAQLDTLMHNQPAQRSRLYAVDSLLQIQHELFVDYLRLRYNLIRPREFDRQLSDLSAHIEAEKIQADTNVVTREKTIKTTRIIPADSGLVQQQQNEKSGWLKRIFSKSKKNEAARKNNNTDNRTPQVIVEEQVNIHTDTLAIVNRDSILAQIGTSIKQYETDRTERRKKLRVTELDLLEANEMLSNELQGILTQVKAQETQQFKQKTNAMVDLADSAINTTRIITVLFIILALVLAMLIFSDVTRSNTYRRQLEAAKAEAEYHSMAKQRFLANMSHEIRTPLQSIIGYAEQLSAQQKPDRKNLEAIHYSAEHLLHIVNEVLDYSRIISGRFSFQQTPFNMPQLVSDVFELVKPQAEKKGLEFELVTTGISESAYVSGDPFRLKQVLLNLLGNAIKFTGTGRVCLAVNAINHGKRASFTFTVADTGMGIHAAELKNIFRQFEQAGDSNLSTHPGTGLGLSIVKELVEAQNGSISVKSELGQGSEFTVTMRYMCVDPALVAQPYIEQKNTPVFTGMVWIVDDDELILNLCSAMLARYSIPHECFATAEALLARPWNNAVQLVFADMRLPGMNGIELCNALRKKAPHAITVIALTAQVMPEEKSLMLASGFNGLLLKPFTEDEFIQVLEKHAQPAPVAEIDMDLEPLLRMVEDKAVMQSILAQCHTDTLHDTQLLRGAIDAGNTPDAALVVHRIAGRVGQVGGKILSGKLREAELALRRQSHINGMEAKLNSLVSDIGQWLDVLQKQIEPV